MTGGQTHPVTDSTPTLEQATVPSPRTTPVTTKDTAEAADTDPDIGYQYLQPLLAAYAASTPHQPARARLREQLVTGYLPVARNIARRYAGRGEPLADLEQVGCIGLLKALERYDPDLGHHFLAFAVPTITGEIRRHFRDKTWVMRVPRRLTDLQGVISTVVPELSARLHRSPRPSEIAAHLQIPAADIVEALQAAHAYRPNSLDRPLHGEPGDGSVADTLGAPEPRFELFDATHSLAPHLAALPEREHNIVIMRFYQDMTQTQIAEKIGISQMHVSRLLAATLTRLREAVDTNTNTDTDTTQQPPPTPPTAMQTRTAPQIGEGNGGVPDAASGCVPARNIPTPTTPATADYRPVSTPGEVCFICMRPRPFCVCPP